MSKHDKEYVDISKISVIPISKSVAKDIIEKYHYTHRFSSTRYSFGIFYKNKNSNSFFEDNEIDKLIGCVTYGFPVGRLTAQSISNTINDNQVLELTRLFIHDGYGTNVESYSISESFKWIKRYDSEIKAIISYADPQVGHLGKIYQALNFLYQGDKLRKVDGYALKYDINDELWLHARTIFSRYNTTNIDELKKLIGKTFWLKLEERKHRYIYILGSKTEKKRILNNLKHPTLPYPKEIDKKDEEIIKVVV